MNRFFALIASLLAGLALHQSAQAADWRVEQRNADVELPSGAVLHRFSVEGEDTVDFTIVQFQTRQCAVKIIDQPTRSSAVSLGKAMANAGAIAGVNGGFFTPDFAPLGLVIADGQRAGTWMRSSLLGGAVVVKNGRLLVLWRDEVGGSEGISQLLQAGPRLVNNGQPVQGLENKSHRPRTFIATNSEGGWLLGIAESTTIANLAQILAKPGLVPHFDISRALNFDGGKSTGLWARTFQGEIIYESEFSTVRNFVVIVPRK